MNFLAITLLGLSTWRLASLFAQEEGPWSVFARLRSALGVRFDEFSIQYGTNLLSKGIICIWCDTIWIGFALIVVYLFLGDKLLWVLAPFYLSAIAILIDKQVTYD